MTEKEIIKGCIENYREYQKALYQKFYGKMFSVCLRYSSNENEAHEILQEGFLFAYKNILNYKSEEPLEDWLKNIMIKAAIIHIRNDKEKRMIVSTVHENKGNLKIKPVEITDEYIVENLNNDLILNSIQQLTSGLRIVFNLLVIDGFTIKQISEKMDVSEDTAKNNYEKAKYTFRQNLIAYLNKNDK